MLQTWLAIPLWKRIFAGMLLGSLVGLWWGDGANSIRWVGDVFVQFIRMLVVPLIFVTLVSGIVAMGNPKKLGSIGIKTFAMYMLTTALAISIGLLLGTLFEPGVGVNIQGVEGKDLGPAMTLSERLLSIIPENPVAAMSEGKVLAVIVFALILGIGIVKGGDKTKLIGDVFTSASHAMLKVTYLVMELAPFGVFALMAWVLGVHGVESLLNILLLFVAVYVGGIFHIWVVQSGLVCLVTKAPYFTFVKGVIEAQLVAFSTSSSAATLPVTLTVAENKLGIGKPVRASVLPLGATVNMDGTGIYVGIVTLFAAQIFGVDISLMDYVLIALATTLVSIGSASVPSASLFLLAGVLDIIGISPSQTALIVGFILPFDRILDMFRTVINVTGDLSVASCVAKWEGELTPIQPQEDE